MRKLLVFSLALLLSACTGKPNIEEARAVSSQIGKALNARDTGQLQANLAEDAVLTRGNAAALVGRDAIVKQYVAAFQQINYDVTLTSEAIEPAGEYAIDRGRFEGTLKSADGKTSSPVFGKYFHVLKWQPGGNWKVWQAVWTFTAATSCSATGARNCCCKDIGGNDCIKRPETGCTTDYPLSILLP